MHRAALLSAWVVLTGCAKSFPSPPPTVSVRDPLADSVESVIFLIGDAGNGSLDQSPILHRLRAEVEQWSRTIRDSSVLVLYLGDNVYPVGVRAQTDPQFPTDSMRLQAQLDVVSGPNARAHVTRAIFIAGNHDWGHKPGQPGRDRLANEQRLVSRRARAGAFHADFQPLAGDPGPSVVYVGRSLKLLLLDTAWWLLEADYQEKLRFLEKLAREMSDPEGRELLIAAHHPWQSGSAHGGLVPFWQTIGVRWLLARSGATLQDLNSLPYRDLKNQFSAVFSRYQPPLLFAGGHDHNLQVIRASQDQEPRFQIVSGAGSKASNVGPTDGTLFYSSNPGFMRLVALKNGAVELFVVSASAEFRSCTATDLARRLQCLEIGAQSFHTVFSTHLK